MATKGKQTRRPNSSVDDVTAYAAGVASGEIIAGPHVRDACARHLRDLSEGAARGLVWDVEAAAKAIRYFPTILRLNGGQFEGLPFHLLRWQKFIVGSLHGWRRTDGWRRFRVAYVETAKGSGKSPLAAGIGLFGLTSDNEARAEIYAAATKKDQAMILFRDAVAMVDQSPELSRRLTKSGVGEKAWNLAYLQTGSFFRPVSADDGQSGPRPHVSLIDEVHEHKTALVIEMMRAGTKSRRQALMFMITNSGADKTSPCWQYHQYAARVCAGELVDDAFFGYVCALDVDDDPIVDETCWPKSNPSLLELDEAGKPRDIPGFRYLREQVNEARGMPSKESIVRRLNFCQWTDAANPWLSLDVWKAAARKIDRASLRGRRAVAGLDLSSTTDLTALVILVEPLKPSDPWIQITEAWIPDEDVTRRGNRDMVPYAEWIALGHLNTTPGRAVSKLHVLRRLAAISEEFDLFSVAYDTWRIEDLKQLAEDGGVELPLMFPFGQGFKSMSPAIEQYETMLLNGQLVHDDNPVANWNASNAVCVGDDAGNRKLSKQKATGRIDVTVASVMAAGRVIPGDAITYLDEAEITFL